MTLYDFWRAKNEGRPIAEYLKWLASKWADFRAETQKGFPHSHMDMVHGADRYAHFDVWLRVSSRGGVWGI